MIRQGDEGDNLYVIDSGELDCYKKFPGQSEQKHLKVYAPGESFGELALLYNAPRAATIIAKTQCVLFALDRDAFNNIVKESAVKKRNRYDEFLKKVELLATMDNYERSKIADALRPQHFKKGQYIVKMGEVGDTFFFLEEGSAIATKPLSPGADPTTVFEYKSGDYFGELALLKNTSRAANIVATVNRIFLKRIGICLTLIGSR